MGQSDRGIVMCMGGGNNVMAMEWVKRESELLGFIACLDKGSRIWK